MRLCGVLTARMVLVLLIVVMLPITASGSGVHLYLYGATWCPACRALNEFLSREYPGSYYFCKIDVSEACLSDLNRIAGVLSSKGVPLKYLESIPQTYVVRDGRYLVAVVIGAVTDSQFWKNIIAREPQERVALVIPPDVYEIPMAFQEQYELVALITKHAQASALEQKVNLKLLIPIVLVASGVILVTYAVLGRRKR